jgi:hypothetical protein
MVALRLTGTKSQNRWMALAIFQFAWYQVVWRGANSEPKNWNPRWIMQNFKRRDISLTNKYQCWYTLQVHSMGSRISARLRAYLTGIYVVGMFRVHTLCNATNGALRLF